MQIDTTKSVYCCPECSGVLNESGEGLRCTACRRQYPCVEGIPVFAGVPVCPTDALTEHDVSMLLEQIEDRGWTAGLRSVLLQLDDRKARAGHAEFSDPRGVLGPMMVGGPHHTSVLCLGCTAGAVPFVLAERFERVTVCDLSLGRLRILEKRSNQEELHGMTFVCGGDTRHLPFRTREFNLVLVDAAALPDICLKAPSFWCEVTRVLSSDGTCFVAGQNGHDPRRLFGRVEGHSRLGFLTPRFVRTMLGNAGLDCHDAYGLLPDSRTPEVLFDLGARQLSRTIGPAPRAREHFKSSCLHNSFFAPAFGLAAGNGKNGTPSQSGNGRRSFVEGILHSAQKELRGAALPTSKLVPRRITVRRSGRMVIVASSDQKAAPSVVIKVPCSSQWEQAEQRNADALRSLHASDVVPAELKRLVPRHLARGSFGGQTYFVEDAIDGIERGAADTGSPALLKLPILRRRKPQLSITGQFADVLLKLHKATARTVTFGAKEFSAVQNALLAVRMATEEAGQRRIWDTIETFLKQELLGRTLPLVWSHGDAGCNFLEDRNGTLTGIIDWDTFDKNGLPLCDWILLSVGRRTQSTRGVGWACLRTALTGERDAFFGHLPLDDYLTALKLDRRLIPALALSTWVQYAAHRLAERGCNPDWLRRIVFDVLELCEELF